LRERKPERILDFKRDMYEEINGLILYIIPKKELMMFLCQREEKKVQFIEDLFQIVHGTQLLKSYL